MDVSEVHNETFEIKDSVNPDMIKMNVFEAIATRRSIRKYTSQDVPMEILGLIIDAGRYAPSAGNTQNWRFIIIKDPSNRQKIAEASMQQLWIAEAPILICVVSETEKLKKFYGVRGERLYSVQNCAAAVQNMLLTAHALGLASCWISSFDEEVLSRTLGLPGEVRPQAVLPIGYPDEIVPAPSHYTMENVTYFEAYGRRFTNIERIMQNPLVFDKISRMISGFIEAGKDAMNKKKK
ncbi:MAG: nitroreductase family protein [Candidatus Woesearchaeota archaeon]|nr:nitroreductase family protein [Candidatus Woesearchaeota archaeon]